MSGLPDRDPVPAEPTITGAFDRAVYLAEQLTTLVAELEQRLDHVLRPDEPSPEADLSVLALDRSTCSGLCTELRAHGDRLSLTIDRLRVLAKRVDL